MAMIETWYTQDLQNPVQVHHLHGNVFSQDNQGNLIGVNVMDDGDPATLSGTVSGNVIRSDGATVAVTGVLTGNQAYIILPQTAYAVPGVVSIVIKLTGGGSTTTLCAVVAQVYLSATGTMVDPGTIIPSISDLIDAIDSAVASIPADYSTLWAELAPNFSSSKTGGYVIGEYVTYNGKIYQFINNHSGTWAAADVKEVNICGELAKANAGIFNIDGVITLESGTFTDGTTNKVANVKRIRNIAPIPIREIQSINIPSGYSAWVNYLDSNCAYISNSGSWVTSIDTSSVPTGTYYLNIAIRNTSNPNSDISAYIASVQTGIDIVYKFDIVSKQVGEISKEIASLTDYEDIPVGSVASGYLGSNGGYGGSSDALEIRKYPVYEGEYLRLVIAFPFETSGGVFQFQNNNAIPYPPNSYIVGNTYTSAFDGYIVVPNGATWLMVTCAVSNTSNIVKRLVPKEHEHYPLKVDGATVTEQDLYVVQAKAKAVDSTHDLFAFAWQTDTHLFSSGTVGNQMNLVSAGNIPGTQFILNNGDLINGGYYPAAQMKISLAEAVGNYKKAVCPYFQVFGNHDDNSLYQNGSDVIGYEDWFAMVNSRIIDYNITAKYPKRYFSRLFRHNRGNSEYRYLVICLDSGDVDYNTEQGAQYIFGFRQEQLQFLIDTLNFTQYNEMVMVFVHCPLDGETTAETVHNLELINGILDAFANHSSYTGSSSDTGWEASVSCDFTGKTNQHLLGVFQGHAHRDNIVTTHNVNYITLDNGFIENDDTSGKVDAIDYVVIDVANKKVKMFRLGGGSGVDREVSYI